MADMTERRPPSPEHLRASPETDDQAAAGPSAVAEAADAPSATMVVGNGSVVNARIYAGGEPVLSPPTLHATFAALDETPDSFAWIGLYRPSHREMQVLAAEFGLNSLAVEDTLLAHQRPKLERYEDSLFLVLRAAHYVDVKESVIFGEIHAFVGERFVITVRHSESPDLTRIREALESEPARLAKGPSSVLLWLLDAVVDDYEPVVAGLENDADEIETQVFAGSSGVSKRIHALSREVIDFQRAVRPLRQIIDTLRMDRMWQEAGERPMQELRDIEDHAIVLNERVDALRDNLHGILNVNIALRAQQQNDEMRALTETSLRQGEDSRRIAAWAGVLFLPSLVAGAYGMNFEHMPELHWGFGYPFAVGLMLLSALVMYLLFKWKNWL